LTDVPCIPLSYVHFLSAYKLPGNKATAVQRNATDDDAVVHLALNNYETFNHLPHGSSTLDMIQASSAGISGWASFSGLDQPTVEPSIPTQGEKDSRLGRKRKKGDMEEDQQLQRALLESIGCHPPPPETEVPLDYECASDGEYEYESDIDGDDDDDLEDCTPLECPSKKLKRGDIEEAQLLQRALLESIGSLPTRPETEADPEAPPDSFDYEYVGDGKSEEW
jgi:hypothetical protein